ncbi:MAG: excinuclease ABC subunit UvrC [Candidatus Thorarchaeota archaeon]
MGTSVSGIVRLVRDLPDEPGVYIWRDKDGKILYIGKAKSLRKRVSSYLRKRGLDRKTRDLMKLARDLETIVTATEREALIVEATLIKKHQPKFNLALKDDRRHAWVRINVSAEVPSAFVTRDFEKDGSRYFGPYSSTRRLEKTLSTVRKFIPVASCRDPTSARRECIDYHLGRCAAPCTGRIDLAEYRGLVQQLILFLEGAERELIALLEREMREAAGKLDFERAAMLRDRLSDLQLLMRRQRVFDSDGTDRDVLGISRTEEAALVQLLTIRGGRLIGSDHFMFDAQLDVADEDIITSFIEQYYFTLPKLPEEILLPCDIPDRERLAEWLSHESSHRVRIIVPVESQTADLVQMANTNAYRALRKVLILGERGDEVVDSGVRALREALGLRRAPLHIEGFDIANIQGTDPTGSCVVFRNGVPDKKSYRMFRIRVKETPDDYAMMNEVVYRRYRGVLDRGDPLPDLIVIDGGKGQLSSATDALRRLGLDYVPIISIAKREEIIFTPSQKNGIALPETSPALKLVQRVRDEAHRFAQRYYHKLREKHVTGTLLEEAPGIGPRRRAALLKAFGSIDGVRAASVEELARVDGMTLRAARNLKMWLECEQPE